MREVQFNSKIGSGPEVHDLPKVTELISHLVRPLGPGLSYHILPCMS